ncbi:unnamed protein product, partial [Ixodes persulcatus]
TRTWSLKRLTPTSPAILGMIQARSWQQTVSCATCQLVHASTFLKVPCGRKPQHGISSEGTVLSLCKYIVSHVQETSIDQAHSKCHGTKCKHILKGDHFTKHRCHVCFSDLNKTKQRT